jgi:hypothetical protein
MRFRSLLLVGFSSALLSLAVGRAQAQSANAQSPPPDEQNETMRDTLKRMQIKREEEEHKKLVEKAVQLKEAAESLAKEAAGNRLARAAEKKLKEIEKSAKHIRSESGGSDDNRQLDPSPATLSEALKQLGEASQRLHSSMEKTSRHVVSAAAVAEATEIIQLVKIIRSYLN